MSDVIRMIQSEADAHVAKLQSGAALDALRAEMAALEAEQAAADAEHAASKARRKDRLKALKRAVRALGGE
jgi:hypothetical protein